MFVSGEGGGGDETPGSAIGGSGMPIYLKRKIH